MTVPCSLMDVVGFDLLGWRCVWFVLSFSHTTVDIGQHAVRPDSDAF